MKISACWIAKNEADNLALSIESVMDIADELIVVDTGSTDNTVAIAESLGARVEHFTWIGDFSAARNHALSLASGEIIVFLDADEWFQPRLGQSDRERIEGVFSGNARIDSIGTERRNYEKHNDELKGTDVVARIFRNDETLRYQGRIHEYIGVLGGLRGALITDSLGINHSGYSKEVSGEKIDRNVALLETGLSETETGGDEWVRFHLYLVRELFMSGKTKKAAEHLTEALKHPTALTRVCLAHDEVFLSTLYAAIQVAAGERGAVRRKDIYQKLFCLIKKTHPNYPGAAEIDLLYQALFDMKEDRFLREIEPAVEAAARKPPSSVSYYRDFEQLFYEQAALAAWRRGDRMKTLEYAVSALQRRKGKRLPWLLDILLQTVKDQPARDIILLLNSLFDTNAPDDLDFIIKETRIDGLTEVHSYYLKKRTDTDPIRFADYLALMLIHKKYDTVAEAAAEAFSAGNSDAARFVFLAAITGTDPFYAEVHAEMLKEYTHILHAFETGLRLPYVLEADANLLRETFDWVAFTAGLETADRYLEVFRSDPSLVFSVKAPYCESSGLAEWLLREDISIVDQQGIIQYVIQAMITVGRYADALREIEGIFHKGVMKPVLIHMLLVIVEKASGEIKEKARLSYERTSALSDELIELTDIANTGIVTESGNKKLGRVLTNMSKVQFDQWLAEEAERPVVGALPKLYRQVADIYRENGQLTDAAGYLTRLLAIGCAEERDCEMLADMFTQLDNSVVAGALQEGCYTR